MKKAAKKPLTTTVVLRNPGTEEKEKKKYYRSTRVLKWGSRSYDDDIRESEIIQLFDDNSRKDEKSSHKLLDNRAVKTETSIKLAEGPTSIQLAEGSTSIQLADDSASIKLADDSASIQLTDGSCRSLFKAGPGILSYGLFWGMIYAITASFLKITLNTSGTKLVYYVTWMMKPVADLIFGWLLTTCMSSPLQNSEKFWKTILSAAFLIGSSMIFFAYIPRLGESISWIILSTILTVICFAVMMISINGYMLMMSLVAQPETGIITHYGLRSGLNGIGQIIAMGIIIYFGQNKLVDDAAPAILGVGFVLMLIFIILTLSCGQYWPCCEAPSDDTNTNNNNNTTTTPFSSDYFASSLCLTEGRCVTEGTSSWLIFFFIMVYWIALFALLPWSVDWYASTYYSSEVGSPEYSEGVRIASWARFYQQLAMGGFGFFMLFVSKLFFKEKDGESSRNARVMISEWQKKLKIIWCFILMSLTVYSGCLFVAAFTNNADLAYAALVVSGPSMTSTFLLGGFQSYRNSWMINVPAMIGQMIILSVAHFGFHFNYRWVFVTGGTAGGIAILLGMLLMVFKPRSLLLLLFE
jgi:hypothetical protein